MAPKSVKGAACQRNQLDSEKVDLSALPVQTCWPGDAGPLITWGLVVTRGPEKPRQNLGIYRMQVIGRNRVIMRWLAHRGGALDFRDWQRARPGEPFPVAVALGADPAQSRLEGLARPGVHSVNSIPARAISMPAPCTRCASGDPSRRIGLVLFMWM